MNITALKPYDWFLIGQGTLITVALCALALTGGTLIGCLACAPTVWPRLRLLRLLAVSYVEVFRSTPLLLQIIALYFAFPLFGIQVPAVVAAGLALVLYSGAYLTEVFRAGLEAVHRGQWEAALSLGLSRWQVLTRVIMPQAVRVVLPAGVGFAVMLVKGSAIVSVIGFTELTRAGRLVVDWTREAFAVWLLVAVIYFAICYPLSALGRRLERRLGYGTAAAT
jgi:polar amino acid transport system permease protein